MEAPTPATRVQFGVHSLDLRSACLTRGTDCRQLQPQPARLLVLLVERAGDVVTREQIRERLWPGSVVTSDQNINFAIRQIRVALGPDAGMVQTVPRAGYRFVGDVQSSGGVEGGARGRRPEDSRGARVTAARVVLALTVGFGAGLVVRAAPAGQFVYDHVVHPTRCPYIRPYLKVLLPS